MSRDKFVFKKSWLLAIEGYASNVRCEFYEAVFTYLSCGRTVDLVSGGAKRAFASVKKDIDSETADDDRQRKISDARRAAQRKSVEARRAKKEVNVAKIANADFANGTASEGSDATNSSRTCDIGNQENIDDDKNNNSKKKKENAEKKDKVSSAAASQLGEEKTEVDTRKFITFFNKTLESSEAIIPHDCHYTRRREVAIKARAKENGKSSLRTMVVKAAYSSFLNGGNERAWVASLDWLLRPNNFVKVIEGNYDNQVNNSKFKVNNYGKTQQTDNRRGFAAEQHEADEY